MKRALRSTVAAAAIVAVLVGASAPVHADEPAIADALPEVTTHSPADFVEAAAELPAELVDAVERDLGLDAAEYLAEAEAANDAAELVSALIDAGISVTGGEYDSGEVTVYVQDARDVAAVESTGATAVVGEPEPLGPIEVEAAGDIFSGQGWGYKLSPSSSEYLSCSIGFPGYDASGNDVIATAGHCFGTDSNLTGTSTYDGRGGDPVIFNRSKPSQIDSSFSLGDPIGTLVPSSKEFGNGRDVALLAANAPGATVRPQVAQWGGTGFSSPDVGIGAPLATTFRLTGMTAGIVGAPLCKSGARTGWTCGTVTAVDHNVAVSGKAVNTVVSDACLLQGDSGGVAVIGTEAVGINSGSGFSNPPPGSLCSPGDANPVSVFFHLVDPGLDGDNRSVTEKFGSAWTLCTGPVPIVTTMKPGGDRNGPVPIRGKVPCAVAGATTTVALSLNGTPHAVTTPASGDGAFEFSLAGLAAGTYSYTVSVATNGTAEPITASGSFRIVNYAALPTRLQGPDRYATAAAIAQEWDKNFDANVVFVATGENYPDALSAAAAAAHIGAPVLLTKKNELPSGVKKRLDALKPNRVIVLGSTASISNSVVNALKKVSGSPAVQRIAGTDRYDTARKIIRYAFADGSGGLVDVPSIVIATGTNFPDALSAAPAVAREGGAVILVDGGAKSIPSATLSVIDDLNPGRIIIAGTTASVSQAIQTQLTSRYGASIVKRIAGADRYETSRRLTAEYWNNAPAVFFAVGSKYPDALAGAALAGALSAPLIVTQPSCMSSSTKSLVQSLGANARVLLGSSASIKDSVRSLKTC